MPPPAQQPVFVYGSLRKGELFYGLISGYIEKEVLATLPGMQMYDVGDFPALVVDETAEEPARGEVLYFYKDWWVRAIEDMDHIESEGRLYCRTQATVTLADGTQETVWVYVLNDKQMSVIRLRKVKGNDWKLRKAQDADLRERYSGTQLNPVKGLH